MKLNIRSKLFRSFILLTFLLYALMPAIPEFYLMFISIIIFTFLLIFLLFVKTPYPIQTFLIVKPLIYGGVMLCVLQFFIRYPLLPEKVIIVSVIVMIIIGVMYYILKGSFIILRFMPKVQSNIAIILGVVFGFLLIPNLIFTFFIYDFISNLYQMEKDIKTWDWIYFSFSLHFMTPLSEEGNKIAAILSTDYIGQFAMNAHIVLNKVIELTGIALIVNLFGKRLKNDS